MKRCQGAVEHQWTENVLIYDSVFAVNWPQDGASVLFKCRIEYYLSSCVAA
jgi:hypothetical protein